MEKNIGVIFSLKWINTGFALNFDTCITFSYFCGQLAKNNIQSLTMDIFSTLKSLKMLYVLRNSV